MEEHNGAHSTRVKVLHDGTVYVGFIKRHKRSSAILTPPLILHFLFDRLALGGQVAHQGRGAADRGEYRQAGRSY